MAMQGCANVTLDTQRYSAPVPVIGLYIAGGSLVCLLLMICDIVYAYRRRKPWIPCRFFQFNSFTLTVLAVATKLPVDLTTTMPTALDQLSKLCGTQLICICIAFMTPCTGDKKYSDNLANVASLAVMVITVIVNICMQMATGVIFSFMIEHIVTLIFMFLLLVILSLSVCHPYNIHPDLSGGLLQEEQKASSMLEGLKRCYVSNYVQCSGLNFYNYTCYATMGLMCIGCLIIVSVATVKAFFLEKSKICGGFSDYKWSMPIVILTQLLTLAVGGIAIGFRSLFLVSLTDTSRFSTFRNLEYNFRYIFFRYLRIYPLPSVLYRLHITKVSRLLVGLALVLVSIMYICFALIDFVVVLTLVPVEGSFARIRKLFIGIRKDSVIGESGEMNTPEEQFSIFDVSYCLIMDDWLKQRIREQWKMTFKKHKRNSSAQFIELLSQNPPSMQPTHEGRNISCVLSYRNNCLQLVLLGRTIAGLTQSSFGESVLHALEETFEILYFVEEATRTETDDRYKRMYAKDIWMGRRSKNHWFQKEFIEPIQKHIRSSSHTAIEHETFGAFVRSLLEGWDVQDEMYICQVIDSQWSESMEGLCAVMKQAYVDILCSLLNQLPSVLFNYISDSPFEELEERIEISLKFLCELNLVDSKIPRSLPEGEDIIRFCRTTQTNTQVEDNGYSDGGVSLNVNDVDARMSSPTAHDIATDQV